jgi:hypothetical protein
MDKLEQYLDQVCRSMGGPRALRQHVRQELREHLLDAVAHHKAAGLADEVALQKALEEFGKPEDVRTELEATHGHRMLAVVIDKAMQWKERTMKAKWLWATWAYVGLLAVIAAEILFITFMVMFLVPKFKKLTYDGIVDIAEFDEQGVMWLLDFLYSVCTFTDHYMTYTVLGAVAVALLFEWRVKSENKHFMRVAALGTVGLGLLVVIALTAGSMMISFMLGLPAIGRMSRPWAEQQIATADAATAALEQALTKKDWEAMPDHAKKLQEAMTRLSVGPALNSLTTWKEPPPVEELRKAHRSAEAQVLKAQAAIVAKDAQHLEAALQEFRRAFSPIRDAAKRPAQ